MAVSFTKYSINYLKDMKQFSLPILQNTPLCQGFYQLSFAWDESAGIPMPGQFLTVRVSSSSVPLLRRPFAISAYDPLNKHASFIYQKRGAATEILAGKATGELADVIAPLGSAFTLPPPNTRAIVVAGGVGLGPILFLSTFLRQQGIDTTFVFGCRSSAFVPRLDAFEAQEPVICTDDGSVGVKGTVIEYLRTLPHQRFANARLYCCGPEPMLRACHEFSGERAMGCEVSVEQVMACGVGACMGCVVKVNYGNGYARACKEGPVFNSEVIRWS